MDNQKGFSLVGVMIATGIMSIVTLGMMTQMQVQLLQQATADTKASVTALGQSITGVAMNVTSCTAAITRTPQTYTGGVLNARFDLPDGRVIMAGQKQPDYSSVTVGSFTYGGTKIAQLKDGTKVYFGTITAGFEAGREIIGPKHFAPRSLGSIYITTEPGTDIVYCGASVPPEVAKAQAEKLADDEAAEKARREQEEARIKSDCLLSGGSYSNGGCSYKKNDGKDGADRDGNAGGGNDDCTH